MSDELNIGVLGLSHKTAPLMVREKVFIPDNKVSEVLLILHRNECIYEVLVVSTCNRVEIYVSFHTEYEHTVKNILLDFLRNYHEIDKPNLTDYLYWFSGEEAVRHIMRVAGSLDSQVIGENQILGQILRAYLKAKEAGTIKGLLDEVTRKAIAIGRKIRSDTRISEGNVSIGKLALKMAERKFNSLRNKKILIIGAGETAEIIANYLKEKQLSVVLVANRTYLKACALALKLDGRAIRFDELEKELSGIDIIVSSTAAPHLMLKKEKFIGLKRKNEILIFDLAVPRDIDPDIGKLEGVTLYDIEKLEVMIEENYKKRLEEAKKAEEIINRELKGCRSYLGLEPEAVH